MTDEHKNLPDEQTTPAAAPDQKETTPVKEVTIDPGTEQDDQDLVRGITPEFLKALQESTADIIKKFAAPALNKDALGVLSAGISKSVLDAMTSIDIEKFTGVAAQISEYIKSSSIMQTLEYFNSERWQETRKILEEMAAAAPALLEFAEELEELTPYLEAELAKPEYGGKDIDDLYTDAMKDKDNTPVKESLFMQAVNAARAARDAALDRKQLPQITYKKKTDIALTLGKGSFRLFDPKLWDAASAKQIPGQMSFISASYQGKDEEVINLYCGMTADSFRSVMTAEDYFYLSFIGDAYITGNTIMTISKFYREVTGTRGNTTQLTELYKKLSELQETHLVIRDREVREAWDKAAAKKEGKVTTTKNAKTYKEIRQAAAPITLGAERYVVNGGITEAIIKIHEFPAILKLDLDIGQYTTVPKSLLQVKKKDGRALRRTPRYYTILQYLVHHIARIRHGNHVNKILYSTFYKDIGATTPREQQLALDMFFTMLDHFKNEGWITGYKEEVTKRTGKAGVKFTWKTDDKSIAAKKKTPTKKLPGKK